MNTMKAANRYLAAAVALGVIAIVLFLAAGLAAPALSTGVRTAFLTQAGTPTPLPGDVIPLKPVTDLTSLNATVTLDVNGLIDGKRTQGNLTGLVAMNDQGKSQVTVSGSLLGKIAAQVGGSLVGLFTPSKVDVYKVPGGNYIVVNGLVPVCVKPEAINDTKALDDISPQTLLSMLTGSDVARGKLVGQPVLADRPGETRNGVPVQHYVIDGETFLTAAQNSSDPKLREFGQGLWSAEDAHLYVDAAGGYPVAFEGNFSGTFEPLKFEGDFGVKIDLTEVNSNPRVDLPAACNKPISR